jgi:hypothetical protein
MVPILSLLHEPSNERPRCDARGKRRHDRESKMPVETVSCLIQEFFARIATLLRGMPHDSHSILDSIGNGSRCARSLVS